MNKYYRSKSCSTPNIHGNKDFKCEGDSPLGDKCACACHWSFDETIGRMFSNWSIVTDVKDTPDSLDTK